MATHWGSNSLAPGSSQGWFFARDNTEGFLPYISVIPTSPSFTPATWSLTSGGYPFFTELGISTQWSQLSGDLVHQLLYFIVVQNNSNNTVEYSFVEADF